MNGRIEALGVETEDKVDEHGDEQHDREDGGAEAVVVRARSAIADGARSPVVRQQCVDHDSHGCGREIELRGRVRSAYEAGADAEAI